MKLKKIILYVCVLLSLTAIVGGGLFAGLNVNDSSDTTQEFIEDKNTSAATAPTNNSYWDESVSRVDTDWSGSGTQADPWLITSAAELAGLSYSIYNNTKSSYLSGVLYYTGKYFKQTADIDVSAYYWQPIGISYNRSGASTYRYFSGNYDGDGHTVSGVFTKSGSTDAYSYQGLFGYVNGSGSTQTTQSSIKNLGVVNSYIAGYWSVGGIVGFANNATITNCYNTGSVNASGNYVGGILGWASSSIVSNCYNTGSVNGIAHVGGIVGYSNTTSNIEGCFNAGEVNALGYVGGIIGTGYNIRNCYNFGNVNCSQDNEGVGGIVGSGGNIYNCYNYGNVTGIIYVGGIMGMFPGVKVDIINCYNSGVVTGLESITGGVFGDFDSSCNIVSCYYGGSCTLNKGVGRVGTATDTTVKISSLNTTQYAKGEAWYQNTSNWDSSYPWDFNNVWTINANYNDGYPVLQWQIPKTWNDYAATSFASGSGTSTDPYIITTPEQLAHLSVLGESQSEISGYYKLGANIDLSGHEWKPIGYGQSRKFTGVFDGSLYTISHLTINVLENEYVGLFTTITGTVKNLVMKDGEISKGDFVGGLAGLLGGATGVVSNCIIDNMNLASTTGTRRYVGAITGWNYNSTISSCLVQNCTLSGNYAGALFGYGGGATSSKMVDNFAISNTVSGTSDGLYGQISSSVYSVSGCYSQAIINSTTKKLMYGDSTAWTNWAYNAMLNGGYPVQTTLFHIGGLSGSANVYNYLKNTLGFTVA